MYTTKAGTQLRILEAGTRAENMEEFCVIAYFLWFDPFPFLDRVAYLPRDGFAQKRVGPSTSITKWGKTTTNSYRHAQRPT